MATQKCIGRNCTRCDPFSRSKWSFNILKDTILAVRKLMYSIKNFAIFFIFKECMLHACIPPGALSGTCNRSYCKAGIWGWLEDGSPPWRLLVPLWWLHLSQDQFCTTRGVRVGHKGSVVVKRTPVRPNSNSAEFHAWVVLNYKSYVVLE